MFENGNITLNGNSVRFQCNPGYNLLGPSVVQCFNGQLNDTAPICSSKEIHLDRLNIHQMMVHNVASSPYGFDIASECHHILIIFLVYSKHKQAPRLFNSLTEPGISTAHRT